MQSSLVGTTRKLRSVSKVFDAAGGAGDSFGVFGPFDAGEVLVGVDLAWYSLIAQGALDENNWISVYPRLSDTPPTVFTDFGNESDAFGVAIYNMASHLARFELNYEIPSYKGGSFFSVFANASLTDIRLTATLHIGRAV